MKLLFLALLLISASSCKIDGTATGNPTSEFENGDGNAGMVPPGPLAIERLLSSYCSRVTACFASIRIDKCHEEIFNSELPLEELGLPLTSGYSSFEEVLQAEWNGVLEPNEAVVEICLEEIENLACQSPVLTGAYDLIVAVREPSAAGSAPLPQECTIYSSVVPSQ